MGIQSLSSLSPLRLSPLDRRTQAFFPSPTSDWDRPIRRRDAVRKRWRGLGAHLYRLGPLADARFDFTGVRALGAVDRPRRQGHRRDQRGQVSFFLIICTEKRPAPFDFALFFSVRLGILARMRCLSSRGGGIRELPNIFACTFMRRRLTSCPHFPLMFLRRKGAVGCIPLHPRTAEFASLSR